MGHIELRVKEVAEAKGITNPHHLHDVTGINYSICYRLFNGHTTNLSLPTLSKLCDALKTEPGDLIVYVKDGL